METLDEPKTKVLNLYAGIGGNRKLWQNVEVTTVEINPKIAAIYQDFFPQDKVIVGDAHQFLLDHFKEYDFIWSSPPCPSHSKFRKYFSCNCGASPIYPDMRLYEEILFLKYYFSGKWCVENVVSYYTPLIKPTEIQHHYFWHNFNITNRSFERDFIRVNNGKRCNEDKRKAQVERLQKKHGFNLSNYKIDKRVALRNCVAPELGLHIFNESKKDLYPELFR